MKRTHSGSSDVETPLFRCAYSLPSTPFATFFDEPPNLQRSMTDAIELLSFLPDLPSLSSELKQLNDDTEMISFWPSGHLDTLHQDIGSLIETPSPDLNQLPFSFPNGFAPLQPAVQPDAHPVFQPESIQPRIQIPEVVGTGRQPIPKEKKAYLNCWIESRFSHPYASDDEKADLSAKLGLSPASIFNFLINARTRWWKPCVLGLFDDNKALLESSADSQWMEKIQVAAKKRDPALVIPCLQNHKKTKQILEDRQKKGEADCQALMAELQGSRRERV